VMFKNSTHPKKVNLGIGAYRDDQARPYVLPVIHAAEKELLSDLHKGIHDKEYTPQDGPAPLKDCTRKLVFGTNSKAIAEDRICSLQSLSGTGALRLVAAFIKEHMPSACRTVWVSEPTWGNHPSIFRKEGFEAKTYTYWNENTLKIDFDGMMNDLGQAKPGHVVVLHACAHNPTGTDPTQEQWKRILDLCQKNSLIPILDSAYQGYASGDLDTDAFAVRLFEQAGMDFFMCQSFAKNLGLYGDRVGMVHVVCSSKDQADNVLSQMKVIVRTMYSSPPMHGAHLVMKVLGNEKYYQQWKQELKMMADRIILMRKQLREGLEAKGTPGDWDHITTQIGMFTYTGLTEKQCDCLLRQYEIYLLKSGRISMAGLNSGNIQYMIDSVDAAVRKHPKTAADKKKQKWNTVNLKWNTAEVQ